MSITANVQRVCECIAAAAGRSGRRPDDVMLVAATKYRSLSAVEELYEAGVRNFGESRVQEATEKLSGWKPPGVTLHMIGHIQRNKAKQAVRLFDFVQSVDSVPLAMTLNEHCRRAGKMLPILVEVNISGEAAKHGFRPEDTPAAIGPIAGLDRLQLQGLMGMAPLTADPEDARPYFRRLRALRDELQHENPGLDLKHLSMGMTDDFEVAVEEGATIVRIGRALFT